MIDWIPIGNPNNPQDLSVSCWSHTCGAVSYEYGISKYEVTQAQYAEFLNAKAAADPLGLYPSPSTLLDVNAFGITRSGVEGSYTYEVKPGFEQRPATYISFYDSLRFTNWLNNGQGDGDTETGSYTLLGGTPTPSNFMTIGREANANIVLPSEDEWYKAAFYSPAGVYFDYPTGMNLQIGCLAPGQDNGNAANCSATTGMTGSTPVGAYTLSGSPYGTFDQAGNVWEWNEYNVGTYRGLRGGSFQFSGLLSSASYGASGADYGGRDYGFRVALIPEPAPLTLLLIGLVALIRSRKWHF